MESWGLTFCADFPQGFPQVPRKAMSQVLQPRVDLETEIPERNQSIVKYACSYPQDEGCAFAADPWVLIRVIPNSREMNAGGSPAVNGARIDEDGGWVTGFSRTSAPRSRGLIHRTVQRNPRIRTPGPRASVLARPEGPGQKGPDPVESLEGPPCRRR